jgi:YVTN family beta-propeller protein
MKAVTTLALALVLAVPALAKDTQQLFVSVEKDNAIVIVDATKLEVTGTLKPCKRPRHVQLSADRKTLLVACSDEHRIVVWDLASKKVVDRLNVGEDPEMFDISPDGRMLYASNEEDATLTAYDLVARKKAFYVTSEAQSLVHVIDVAQRKVVKNISVGKRPRRLMTVGTESLWVSNELDASVSVIRQSDHTVAHTIAFKPPGMRADDVTPVGMVLSPDKKTAYVGLGRANHVAVVDVATRAITAYVLVGKRAWGLSLSRDGKQLYVANGLSDDMTVVDTVKLKAIKSVAVGRVPHSVAVDD